jgi:membrane fusion protein, multidrug efflux system
MSQARFLACAWLASVATGMAAQADDNIAVRGIIRAIDQASISTELTARVAAIHVREGERFNVGDVIIEFDCRRQLATLAAADAQQLEMQLSVDKFRMLQRAQSVGKNDLEVAEARLSKAKAESDALRSQIDQCRVIAPFEGRVLELALQRHETVQPGKPFLSLVGISTLELDLIVPSDWVRWIKPGLVFDFNVDEIGRPIRAEVTRIGAAVDPISQTVKISSAVLGDIVGILPGMSGSALFNAAKEKRP